MKKRLCIIHIGMPKTGSSALQESLFSKIHDPSVSYANLPVPSHSAIIFSMFSSWPENHYYHKGRKSSNEEIEKFNNKNRKRLVDGFRKHHSDIEIISGEDIFHLDENGLRRMKDFLQGFFARILIVGYVRPPKSFMESAFQQLVKYHSIDRFNFKIIYPHYRVKLEKFDKIFHPENVRLWKFDLKSFPDSDITLDFCRRLKIKVDKKHSLRSNDSISIEAISLLFANNKYGKKFDFGGSGIKIQNKLVKMIS